MSQILDSATDAEGVHHVLEVSAGLDFVILFHLTPF